MYSNVDHFVLVSETNVTNQRETSLMVQDVVGEPLGDEDKFSAIDTADDFNSGGFRVDPAEGQFFEGDISGVQLKAVDVKSDFDGQLTFGKVRAQPILFTLYFTITLIPLGGRYKELFDFSERYQEYVQAMA